MHTLLPTCNFNSWAVTSLRDSLLAELPADKSSRELTLFFYAITGSGWVQIKKSVLGWMEAKKGRSVKVYAGTDHGITDPLALDAMQKAGLDVHLMEAYRGVFHPKVVWLKGTKSNLVWVASNNLTKDGLLNNIEFAVLIKSEDVPVELTRWAEAVISGSTSFNAALLESYKIERKKFEQRQASVRSTTFTWSKRREPKSAPAIPISKGDLILEIMPEETRGGNQIQIPKQAASEFFGLHNVGDHTTIRLRPRATTESRALVITVFDNFTIRLSLNELEYGDRPCVVVFHKVGGGIIEFEIVSQSIFPSRYRSLLALCKRQTRVGSRRWEIIKDQVQP